jgi:hypothetical protein
MSAKWPEPLIIAVLVSRPTTPYWLRSYKKLEFNTWNSDSPTWISAFHFPTAPKANPRPPALGRLLF